jgi:uncharacterized membrane protein
MSGRRTFVTGLLVILPLAVTAMVLRFLYRTLEGTGLAALIETLAGRRLPGLGAVLSLLIIFLVGLLAENIAGARLVGALEGFLVKVPVVGAIYGPAQQLFRALGAEGNEQEVVAVEFPRKGLHMVGFVTRREGDMITVFLPTAPNPTSGFLVVTPQDEVRALGIPFRDAMALIVSGGIVSPGPGVIQGLGVPHRQELLARS